MRDECDHCYGQQMYRFVPLDPNPCADAPEQCTPMGCEKCMPAVPCACVNCGRNPSAIVHRPERWISQPLSRVIGDG